MAAPGSHDALRDEADDLVILDEPPMFLGVSQFYEEFPQVSDDEVIALLGKPSPDLLRRRAEALRAQKRIGEAMDLEQQAMKQ